MRSSLPMSSCFFFGSKCFAEVSSSRVTLCMSPDGPSKGNNLESKRWTSVHGGRGQSRELTNIRRETHIL